MIKLTKKAMNMLFIIASALIVLLGTGVSAAMFFHSTIGTSDPLTVGQVKVNTSTSVIFSGLTSIIPGAPVVNGNISVVKDANSLNTYVRARVYYSSTTATMAVQNFISKLNDLAIDTYSNANYEWKKFANDSYYYLVQKNTDNLVEISTVDAYAFTTSPITIPLSIDEDNSTGTNSPLYNQAITANVVIQAIQTIEVANTYSATSAIFNSSYSKTVHTDIIDSVAHGKILLNGMIASQTIDLASTNIVNKSDNTVIITVVPNDGYVVNTFTVGGTAQVLTNGCYTHTLSPNVSANQVNVSFIEKQNEIIVAQPANGGSIAPLNGTFVNEGEEQQITLTPVNGYMPDTFMVNNVNKRSSLKLNDNGTYTYTIEDIQEPQEINATFVSGVEIIVAIEEGNGNVITSPINNNASTITLTALNNDIVTAFSINGENNLNNLSYVGNGVYTYNLTNITRNQLVKVSFAHGSYSIATSTSGNGSVYASPSSVISGGNSTVIITPNIGYNIATITLNGANVSSFTNTGHTINLNNITSNQTVSATFAISRFTITTDMGTGTTLNVNPTGLQNFNTQVSVSASVNDDYENFVLSIFETGNESNTITPNAGKFNLPAYNVTVKTTATIKTYTISYSTGSNGSGSSINNTIKTHGTNATLSSSTFSRVGYTQTGWSTTDGGTKTFDLGGTYSSNASVELFPFWTINQFTITADEGAGTTLDVSPTGLQNFNTQVSVSASVNDGYENFVLSIYETGNASNTITLNAGKFNLPAYNVTVKTTATIKTYTISTSVSGGNGTITSVSPSSSVNHGGSVTIVTSPATDYEVDNDNTTTTSGTKDVNGNTITISNVTSNLTVVVSFKMSLVTVSFVSNGVTVANTSVAYYSNVGSANMPLTPSSMSYGGYTWYFNQWVYGASNSAFDYLTMVTEDTTVTAQWYRTYVSDYYDCPVCDGGYVYEIDGCECNNCGTTAPENKVGDHHACSAAQTGTFTGYYTNVTCSRCGTAGSSSQVGSTHTCVAGQTGKFVDTGYTLRYCNAGCGATGQSGRCYDCGQGFYSGAVAATYYSCSNCGVAYGTSYGSTHTCSPAQTGTFTGTYHTSCSNCGATGGTAGTIHTCSSGQTGTYVYTYGYSRCDNGCDINGELKIYENTFVVR